MKIMEDKSLCIPPVRPSGTCALSRKGEVSRETNYFIDYSNFFGSFIIWLEVPQSQQN